MFFEGFTNANGCLLKIQSKIEVFMCQVDAINFELSACTDLTSESDNHKLSKKLNFVTLLSLLLVENSIDQVKQAIVKFIASTVCAG